VRKQIWTWNALLGLWNVSGDRRFVYDQWNLLLELDGLNNNAVLLKYTWGRVSSEGWRVQREIVPSG
jgi:hypothetical protein